MKWCCFICFNKRLLLCCISVGSNGLAYTRLTLYKGRKSNWQKNFWTTVIDNESIYLRICSHD